MRYRLNPWEELQREVNSLFENRLQPRTENPQTDWSFKPSVDIYEDSEAYLLVAEIPGVDPGTVDLRVEDNRLTLQGNREMDHPEKKENYHRIERQYGTFSRTFSLPGTVQQDKIQADYKHGLLRVMIPKRSEVQPKQISVKITE